MKIVRQVQCYKDVPNVAGVEAGQESSMKEGRLTLRVTEHSSAKEGNKSIPDGVKRKDKVKNKSTVASEDLTKESVILSMTLFRNPGD